jgi:hypothetical protein
LRLIAFGVEQDHARARTSKTLTMVDTQQHSFTLASNMNAESVPSIAVDSDEIPTPASDPEPFFQQLLKRMNPAECLLPATEAMQACSDVAYNSCLASDLEEFEFILTGLLKDIRRGHKQRGPALHTLYRLTDREHPANR